MFTYYDVAELHWKISNHSDKEQGCGEGVKDWNVCDHNWRQHRKNWNCKNYSTQSLLWVVAHSPLDGAGEGFSQAKVAEVFSHWTKKDSVGTIHLMTCYCTILNLQVRGHWRSPENIYSNMFEECVTLFVHQYLCMTDIEECNVLKWHQCDWEVKCGRIQHRKGSYTFKRSCLLKQQVQEIFLHFQGLVQLKQEAHSLLFHFLFPLEHVEGMAAWFTLLILIPGRLL